MSGFMIHDDSAINDINPFVMYDFSLPGTLRKTPHFSDFYVPLTSGDYEPEDESPICENASTAGDNTITMCKQGMRGVPEDTIIQPILNIDKDIAEPTRPRVTKPIYTIPDEFVIYKNTDIRIIFLAVILSMILLVSIR